MLLPDCHSRREVDTVEPTDAVFRCAHPKVRTPQNLVTADLCSVCELHRQPPPPVFRPIPTVKSQPVRPVRKTVAVVITCHNYGRFLAEAIESVLGQTYTPYEVVVVDDSSTDDTPQVAATFSDREVRYLRVEHKNVHKTRQAGFEATTSSILCFLDADDILAADYLEKGVAQFDAYNVGVVYSDLESFGEKTGVRSAPAVYSPALLERDNYIHVGSLVLREALALSGVFDLEFDPLYTQGDWFLWRRVLHDGWLAKKQPAIYRYRQHGSNWMASMRKAYQGYFDYAGLDAETVTLFIPLSGRTTLWPLFSEFLDRQQWPHDQIKLIFMDTSQNDAFSVLIRDWMRGCDYADVRHFTTSVAVPGLADRDRHNAQVQEGVRTAVARIYNRMAREVTTDYVWVLEDDILPPDDVCERLLRGFDPQTASVSAVYDSRFDGQPCVWDRNVRHYPSRGTGLQPVGGNGFGCVVLRGGLLRDTVFTATQIPADYDRAFYHRLLSLGLAAKVDWSCHCQHGNFETDDSRVIPYAINAPIQIPSFTEFPR
ncbi:MAG: kfoC 1 [Planctomycetaceae bacterium]|nr:kfoC 1 [Planctomycetaceae bacterium]